MKKQFLSLFNKIKYSFALPVLILLFLPLVGWGQCNNSIKLYPSTINDSTAEIITVDSTGGSGPYYWEYGLAGFTPGTDSLPGVGGNIHTSSQGNFTIHGLVPNSNYDIYVRRFCAGVYSTNSAKQTFYTSDVCGSTTALPCAQNITPYFNAGYGSWNMQCSGGNGRERLYTITPTVQGYYLLSLFPSSTINNYSWYYQTNGYCLSTNFTCLGTNDSINTITKNLYLQIGYTYYFLVKPTAITGGYGASFRMDCSCLGPTNVAASNITLTSAYISYTGGGNGTIVELDTTGNPGSGTAPGPGGIIFTGGCCGTTVTGLTPGQQYSVYTRKICSGNLYGQNSYYYSFTTIGCPGIYTIPPNPANGGGAQCFNFGSHLNPNLWFACNGDSLNKYGEDFVRFTPQSSGYYYVGNNTSPNDVFLAYRQTNNTCDFVGFQPLCNWSLYHPQLIYLTGGVTNDFLVEPITIFGHSSTISINPASITNVYASPIQAHYVYINYSGGCANGSLIEYGPAGFTTGTGATAGGGTIVTGVYSSFSLMGLMSNVQYDVYLRCDVGGGIFTPNAFVTFKTLLDCSNAPLVTCGTPFTNSQAVNDSGYWSNYNCGPNNNNGPEKMYTFTPTQNGVFKIRCTQNIGNLTPVNIYYKLASGSCDTLGWACLGTLTSPGDSIYTGMLSSNINYKFLFDEVNSGNAFTKTFQIDCITVCSSTPTTPTSITGAIKPCPGASGIIYSIFPVATATSYTWNVSTGATIFSGAGTNSITVNYDSTFVSGDITVTADNLCGSSAARIKSVSRNVPNTPPGIIGITYGLCGGKTTTYSINVSSLTNTYLWSVPSGVTINSGQGTKNISVTFPANFSPATISVKAGNSCGYGNAQTLVVNATPKPPTIINGPNTVCVNQTGVIYTISSSSNKTTYNWGVPTGATITSGQGSNAIKMNFGTIAGDITVNTANACGAGSNRTLSVAIVCREGASMMNDLLDVNIYPNPSNTNFTVDAHFATEGNYNLIVRDLLGRVVEIYSNINYQQSFNFGKTLHTGIYFVEVSKGDERQVLRVVKSDN